MKFSPDLAEDSPPQDPESIDPELDLELRLILDGDEATADLQTAPDPEADTPEPTDVRERIAKQAGRILGGTKVRAVKSEVSGSSKDYEDDNRHHRGSGAAIWAAMKKLAAETHEKKCLCYICVSP